MDSYKADLAGTKLCPFSQVYKGSSEESNRLKNRRLVGLIRKILSRHDLRQERPGQVQRRWRREALKAVSSSSFRELAKPAEF